MVLRPDRTFKELKGICKLHSVKTTSSQCKIFTRERSCLCVGCINGDDCENKEYADEGKKLSWLGKGKLLLQGKIRNPAKLTCQLME